MAGERTFVVKFISDTVGFNKGIKKVSDDVNGIGGRLSKLVPSFRTLAIAGTAAFGAVAATSIKLVNLASDLEESQSKVNTVFGESARVVNDFAKTSAVSFGITKQAALEAAGTFGNLIQAFGIGRGQAAEMSTTLLGLAADLASFNNTPIEQAIEALRSGLSGEAEPLKRFGVAINDVRLKQEALNLGLYNGKGALDINAKTQAAYALILKDTSLAQGDFARTSGGFANQMRILKASFTDAAAEIGVILLPVFTKFVTFINENVMTAVKRITTVLGEKGLVAAIQQLMFELGDAAPGIANFFEGIAVGAAIAGNTISGVLGGIRRFIEALNPFATELSEVNKIDIDDLRASFENTFKAINNYSVRGIPSAIRAQQGLGSSADDLAGSLAGLIGNDAKGLKGSAKTLKTASDKMKEYSNALKKATSEQDSFNRAQKSEGKALTSLTDANDRLAEAKAKLAQIERGFGAGSPEALAAQAELAKAQRDQERATYAVEEAVFSVADAEKNLAEVRKDPESSATEIRRAEIDLAEAKLSVADATDSQARSAKELNDQQRSLNEAIYGATVGSILYDRALEGVEDATRAQVSAYEAWEDAVTNTKNAQEEFNAALQATADLISKYPKVLGGMPNPMANLVPDSTLANNAGSLFNGGGMGNVNIEVNAGLGASGIQVGQEIDQYLREYLGFSGQTFSLGSIGNFVGVR
jgi:hypothetical protein